MLDPKRKGATTIAKIPAEVLADLNRGLGETVNLSEWLAVDMRQLVQAVLGIQADWLDVSQGPLKRIASVGFWVAEHQSERLVELADHPSDLVRSWVAYATCAIPGLDLCERIARAERLAVDSNMSVRECAWFAVRPMVAAEPERAIELLIPWSQHPDFRARRFASEATRPRGVWCEQIPRLKQHPEIAEPLLEPMRNDPEKYVQLSVANWINDASKTRPDWAVALTRRWELESPTPATRAIIKRAKRTLIKSGSFAGGD